MRAIDAETLNQLPQAIGNLEALLAEIKSIHATVSKMAKQDNVTVLNLRDARNRLTQLVGIGLDAKLSDDPDATDRHCDLVMGRPVKPIPQVQKILDTLDDEAGKMRNAILSTVNSYENEGCDGCGTVDETEINRLRQMMGMEPVRPF